jgi:N-acetylneuraminic acid mutarotase
MPYAWQQASMIVLQNGKVLVAGGVNQSGVVSNAAIYDPQSNIWTTTTSLPQPIGMSRMILQQDGKVRLMSGAVSFVYDPEKATWTSVPGFVTERYIFDIAYLLNGNVIAVGGKGPNPDTTMNSVELYSSNGMISPTPTPELPVYSANNTIQWVQKASMPTERWAFESVTTFDGKIYAIGGFSFIAGGAMATNEMYDPATDVWITRAPLPFATSNPQSIIANNGKIYVIGGEIILHSLIEYKNMIP